MVAEIAEGAPGFKQKQILGISLAGTWVFFMRVICPSVLLVLLLTQTGLETNPLRTAIVLFVVLLVIHSVVSLQEGKK
jgi:hypothetical protein